TVVGKFNSLFKLALDWRFIGVINFVTNDSGAFPFTNEKSKRSELQRKPLRKYEQLFLTLEQLIKHER
ncbi:MAG: hypothetical protein RI927_835, partial [Actinomycetota bacterium]